MFEQKFGQQTYKIQVQIWRARARRHTQTPDPLLRSSLFHINNLPLEHSPKIPHEEISNVSLAQTTIKLSLVAKQPFIPELSTMQLHVSFKHS